MLQPPCYDRRPPDPNPNPNPHPISAPKPEGRGGPIERRAYAPAYHRKTIRPASRRILQRGARYCRHETLLNSACACVRAGCHHPAPSMCRGKNLVDMSLAHSPACALPSRHSTYIAFWHFPRIFQVPAASDVNGEPPIAAAAGVCSEEACAPRFLDGGKSPCYVHVDVGNANPRYAATRGRYPNIGGGGRCPM